MSALNRQSRHLNTHATDLAKETLYNENLDIHVTLGLGVYLRHAIIHVPGTIGGGGGGTATPDSHTYRAVALTSLKILLELCSCNGALCTFYTHQEHF